MLYYIIHKIDVHTDTETIYSYDNEAREMRAK